MALANQNCRRRCASRSRSICRSCSERAWSLVVSSVRTFFATAIHFPIDVVQFFESIFWRLLDGGLIHAFDSGAFAGGWPGTKCFLNNSSISQGLIFSSTTELLCGYVFQVELLLRLLWRGRLIAGLAMGERLTLFSSFNLRGCLARCQCSRASSEK